MEKFKNNVAFFSIFCFIIVFFSLFLEKNDFLGQILDKNNTEREIKKEKELYHEIFGKKKEDFLIKTDNNGKKIYNEDKYREYRERASKFRRFDVSSFISVKKYKKVLMKFESVKKYRDLEISSLRQSNFIFLITSLLGLSAAIIIFFNRKITYILICNSIIFIFSIFYNFSLGKALENMGILGKPQHNWGVSESIQSFAIFGIFIYLILISIYEIIQIQNKGIDYLKEDTSKVKHKFSFFIDWALKNKFAYFMLAPAIIIVILIIIYPFLYNFRIAFSNLNLKRLISFIQGNKLYFNGTENFSIIFAEPLFWSTLLRTLIWTFTNVFFHVLGGVTLAILLNREMKMRPVYQSLIVLPWAIPQFIAVLVWKNMYNQSYGAVNLLLTKFANIFSHGATVQIPWLSDPFWLFTGAIITNIWLGIPFMMLIALGGLQSISETYYEAAEIDGATSLQQIWHITIPQLKPVMTPSIIMGVVWTFNNLNVIYLLSTDTLTGKVDILVTYVYKAAFNLYRYGYAAAFSLIIFAILMVFSIFMIKSSKVQEGVN